MFGTVLAFALKFEEAGRGGLPHMHIPLAQGGLHPSHLGVAWRVGADLFERFAATWLPAPYHAPSDDAKKRVLPQHGVPAVAATAVAVEGGEGSELMARRLPLSCEEAATAAAERLCATQVLSVNLHPANHTSACVKPLRVVPTDENCRFEYDRPLEPITRRDARGAIFIQRCGSLLVPYHPALMLA